MELILIIKTLLKDIKSIKRVLFYFLSINFSIPKATPSSYIEVVISLAYILMLSHAFPIAIPHPTVSNISISFLPSPKA